MTGSNEGEVGITWTAPRDDNLIGGAVTSYDLRYATNSFTDADWDAAWVYQVTGEPIPSSPGTIESMVITELTGGVTYWFAIKSQDEVPNVSEIDTNTANLNQTWTAASVAKPPQVTVLVPDGGEGWQGTQEIKWSYFDFNSGDTHIFEIRLSSDAGGNYPVILTSDLPDGTTSYLWNTKQHPNCSSYKVKVIAVDSGGLSGEDESDEIFAISNPNEPPTATVTSPNGGEYYAVTNYIVWTYADPNGTDTHTFDIFVSSNGGISWIQEATGLEEDSSSYKWNTGAYPDGVNYKVKVIVRDNGSPQMSGEDTSDGSFVINNSNEMPASFSLLSPAYGSTQNIFRPVFD